MLQEINSHSLSTEKWNAAALRQSDLPYSQLFYLQAVHTNYKFLVWNDYEEVFALPVSKKYGLPVSLQPFVCQRFAKVSRAFFNEILQFANRNSLLTELNVELENESGFKTVRNQNFILPLTGNYPEIAKNYGSQTQRNLKKSIKPEFRLTDNPNEIIDLFKVNQSEKFAVKPHFFDVFRQVLTIKELQFYYHLASIENSFCGGTIWMKFGQRHILLMFAQNETGRQYASTYFLIDQYIRQHAESNMVIDFEGSNHEGIAAMLKGFGAQPEYYFTFKTGLLSFLK